MALNGLPSHDKKEGLKSKSFFVLYELIRGYENPPIRLDRPAF